MSAASFLGIAGLVATVGFRRTDLLDRRLVGWPIVMFLIAEPLRKLGRYTFVDVVAFRLRQPPVRIAAAIGSLTVVLVLSDGADGRRRQPDSAPVRPVLRVCRRDRRRGDAGVRPVRRHDRDDLGADRQSRAAAAAVPRCWRCWRSRGSASTRWRCSTRPQRCTAPACWRRAGWSPIRSMRFRSGWR